MSLIVEGEEKEIIKVSSKHHVGIYKIIYDFRIGTDGN